MKRALLATLLMALSVPAAAESGFALGLRAGTDGLGLDGLFGLSDQLSLRATLRRFDDDRSIDPEDVDNTPDNDLSWRGEVELDTAALLLDYHPGGGLFRLSGGLVANGNRFGATSRCERDRCEVGDQSFDADDLGTLTVDLQWDDVAPYLGLGFGHALAPGKRVGLTLDLGVIIQGSGRVTIASDSPRCNADCQDALEDEARELERDAEDFDLYPVLSVGLTLRLF